MLATRPYDLRVLRDCAILLIGFGGGLRRSEIVSPDRGKDDTPATRQLHRYQRGNPKMTLPAICDQPEIMREWTPRGRTS